MPKYYRPGARKGGNKTFVVRGYIDGRQYEFTTESDHRKGKGGAEEAWRIFAESVRAQRGPVPTRETATFAHAVALYREKRPDLSCNENAFIKRLEAELGTMLLSEITLAAIYRAAHKLYPGALPQTKNRQALRPAGAVLHNAARNHLCDWLHIERLRETDPERPVVYPEDMAPLINAARANGDNELVALLATFQMHGWRVTETIMIERGRIDWQRGRLRRWVSKSRKWRWAEVDRDVLALWQDLPEHEDGRLFSYPNRSAVYRAVDGLGAGFRFRPHMARRGLATALKDAGEDLDGIAEIGQWEDPRSVRPYISANPQRARRALEKIRGRIKSVATGA